jgi:dTDP-4-amino-4,6-dideoxygalactose transaminase
VTAPEIPLVDLRWQHREVADEVRVGIARVLDECAFVGGGPVREFERRYAAALRVRHCVGVGNGTDALELALRGAGVVPGDEVVMPAHTFIATAEAVVRAGARPVLADVDPEHLLLTAAGTARVAGRRTRAVVPVHLYGQAAPVERIAEVAAGMGAAVVEDAAQAQGARRCGRSAGGLGVAAGTSFYPGKNLGGYGDAGAVLTDDEALADRVRMVANHGSASRNRHEVLGFNSRLDTVQAVVLSAKLTRLAGWNAARRAAAARYDELLRDVGPVRRPSTMEGNEHVWHLYPVRVPRRDEILGYLHERGIGARVHYPVPVHLQPAFRWLGHRAGDFPVAEAAARELLSLPLYPGITAAQQERVADAVRAAVRRVPVRAAR